MINGVYWMCFSWLEWKTFLITLLGIFLWRHEENEAKHAKIYHKTRDVKKDWTTKYCACVFSWTCNCVMYVVALLNRWFENFRYAMIDNWIEHGRIGNEFLFLLMYSCLNKRRKLDMMTTCLDSKVYQVLHSANGNLKGVLNVEVGKT